MSGRPGTSDEPTADIPRSWALVEETGLLDEHGYLRERSSWLVREQPLTLEGFEDEPCLVLLGEAGLGKSHVIKRLESRLRSEGKTVTAKRFSALTDRAFEALWDDPHVRAWRTQGEPLHLLLDGLDESPLTPERAADRLIALISAGGDLSRLRLRITGRTFAWSERLEKSFGEIFGKPRVLQLLPLRRSQVGELLARDVPNADRELRDLDARGLGPLASRPLTLQLLVDALKATPTLVAEGSQWDLYDRALLHRRHKSPRPYEAHRAADVLGAASVFAGRESFSAGAPGLARSTSLDALVSEDLPESERDERVELLREALLLPGFDGLREERRWEHATFAVFHAARWLAERARTVEEKVRWLKGSKGDGSLDAMPAQVEATAAWLASRDRPLFDRLLAEAPEVLLRCDPASHDADRKRRLVGALLADAERVMSQGWRSLTLIRELGGGDVDAVLDASIRSAERPSAERKLALQIAQASGQTQLASLALHVAISPSEPSDVRSMSLDVVCRHGTVEQRRELQRIVREATGELQFEVIERALGGMWRNSTGRTNALSLGEMLDLVHRSSVTPARSATYRFLEQHFWESLTDEEMPTVLTWSCSVLDSVSNETQREWHSALQLLVARAWQSSRVGDFDEPLGRFLQKYLNRWQSLPLPTTATIEERRQIAGVIVRASREHTHALVVPLADLLSNDSLEWILSNLTAQNQPTDAIWSEVALLCFRRVAEREADDDDASALAGNDSTLELFCEARGRNAELFRVSHWYFEGLELDDPSVILLRENIRRADAEDASAKTFDDHIQQQAHECLQLLSEDAADNFWRFAHIVRHSASAGNQVSFERRTQIIETRWWREASPTTRNSVLRAAEAYLVVGDPHLEEWFDTPYTDHRSDAGYLALQLLCSESRSSLNKLDEATWSKWIPALLSQYLWDYQHSLPGRMIGIGRPYNIMANDRALLELAMRHAETAFAAHVDRVLDAELRRRGQIEVLRRTLELRPPQLIERLTARFQAPLSPAAIVPLLDAIHESNHDRAVTLAVRLLEDPHSGEACRVQAAIFLLNEGGPLAASRLWRVLAEEITLLYSVAESFTSTKPIEGVAPTHLKAVWEKLFARWPSNSDGLFRWDPFHTETQLRDAVMRALTSLSTDKAAAALHSLADAHPELPWLRSNALRAEASAKARRWTPWTLEELSRAADSPPTVNDPAVRELVTVLSNLYKSASAELVCHDAGIPTGAVRTDGPARVVWDAIVSEALNSDRLHALVRVACREYSANPSLVAVARRLGVFAPFD